MARTSDTAFSSLQIAPYLTRMTVFLGLAGLAITFILPAAAQAFMSNPVLNGLIIGVAGIGILNAYRLIFSLVPDIRWVSKFRRADPAHARSISVRPNLLAPMANILGGASGPVRLSAPVARSILDGVQSRLDESRDIARYMTGLLVFLGLLGTFWGLIMVVTSIAGTIKALPSSTEGAIAFDQLRQGLEGPLAGMGTAFSSSLFGLAGSVILGFLDLQTGQAQNRFASALEEWLSTITRLGGAGPAGLDSDVAPPAYLSALLEQTAENLTSLERTIARIEERRGGGGESADVASALRSIETAMRRLADEQSLGREAFISELRQEVKLLGKTLAALGERQRH